MTDHDADLDAIVALLAEGGYLIVVQRPDGGEAYQLTEAGGPGRAAAGHEHRGRAGRAVRSPA